MPQVGDAPKRHVSAQCDIVKESQKIHTRNHKDLVL